MEVIYLNKQSGFDLEDSCVALGFFDECIRAFKTG